MSAQLTSGTVQIAAGDLVRLPMDFGNIRQLVAGAAVVNGVLALTTTIASYSITTGDPGLAVTRPQLDYPYQISGLFQAITPGTYAATFRITLNDPDATVVTRVGTVVVN